MRKPKILFIIITFANLAIVMLPLFLAKGQDGLPLQLDWLRFAKILLAALGGTLAGVGLASFAPKIGAQIGASAAKATTIVAATAAVTTIAVVVAVTVASSDNPPTTITSDSTSTQHRPDSISILSENQAINAEKEAQNTGADSLSKPHPDPGGSPQTSAGSDPKTPNSPQPSSTVTKPDEPTPTPSTKLNTENPPKIETPETEPKEPAIAFNKQFDLREYGYPYLLKIRDDFDSQLEVVPTLPPDFDPPSYRYDWGKKKCVVVVAKEDLLVQPAQLKAYWERHPSVAKVVEKHAVGGKKNSEALMIIRKLTDEKGNTYKYHLTIVAWVNIGSAVPKLLKIYCKQLFNSVEEAEKFSFAKIVLKSGR